ncbi:MAG: hypothetical protein F2534_13490 [Actinobacteria bacterium]|nr:hypothetical protein [Actinomycetota bacterium]
MSGQERQRVAGGRHRNGDDGQGRLAQVIPFRPRPEPTPVEPITWYDAHRFERGARYREIPTGRTGYFIGVSEVPPLTAIDLSPLVLLFRDPETGAMWICSESEAMVGVGYEPVSWELSL